MPSIIDSAKLVFTDSNAPTKIMIQSLTPFIIYNIYKGNLSFSQLLNFPIAIILSIIYLGYLFRTLTNSLQEKNYILSSLNPFKSFWVGLKGIISCGIFTIPIFLIQKYFIPLLDFDAPGSIVLAIIAYLLTGSFLFTSMIFYSKDCKVLGGLNFIKILKNFHEVIVYLALSLVMLALSNLITALPFGGLIYMLFGYGRLFEYAISIIITSNLLIYFQNLSHAYFEQINN